MKGFNPLFYMYLGLPLEDIMYYKDSFDLWDINRDGKVDQWEIEVTAESMGLTAKNSLVHIMIPHLDTDKSGAIEFSEFLTFMTRKIRNSDRNGIDDFINPPPTDLGSLYAFFNSGLGFLMLLLLVLIIAWGWTCCEKWLRRRRLRKEVECLEKSRAKMQTILEESRNRPVISTDSEEKPKPKLKIDEKLERKVEYYRPDGEEIHRGKHANVRDRHNLYKQFGENRK